MEPTWQGVLPATPDQVAGDFANMYVSQRGFEPGTHGGQQPSYKQGPQPWEQPSAVRSPQQGRTATQHGAYPLQQPQSFGWGGEAFPENSLNRIPWFGRSRGGKAGHQYGGRGRGRGERGGGCGSSAPYSICDFSDVPNSDAALSTTKLSIDYERGRRGGRWYYEGSQGRSAEDGLSVEEVVRLLQSLPKGQQIPETVYKALLHFDSRAVAVILKDLSKAGVSHRAVEMFDWLRKLEEDHALRHLCDVYTYTAMIAQCIYQQDVDRALELANEMRARNVERNVHTFTALMNVCIKCGRCPLALETYHKMRQDGIAPNVVTFNTLIDVHGKMGQWEQAVKVLTIMMNEGVEPVLRTYNTLMICCNMCHQPRETMNVYKRMLDEGFTPNATTYNALISAYGKAGQLDKVMEVFQEMVFKGCERSVITYSSLISACEKAGQWELALELFNEMHHEGCFPNTVTFNSLITACAQGAQWEKASEVFEEMQSQGCTPDVVTYTALISSYEKGGQWQRALAAFNQMRHQRCPPDSIVYNAIIDALWETGVIWAQRQALALFHLARREGHFPQQQWDESAPPPARVEINLHAMTAGVAMLSLYSWLMGLRALLRKSLRPQLPGRLALITDKGKSSKEQGNLVVKEAVAAIMNLWEAPFRASSDSNYSGTLEASGEGVDEWLSSAAFEANLFSFFPCTDILPSSANKAGEAPLHQIEAVEDRAPDFPKETSVELRCFDAFSAVAHFERTHWLALQNMGFGYLQRRGELANNMLRIGQVFGLREEVAHDAVLLMDRTMSTSLQVKDDVLDLLAAASVVIASRQGEQPASQPNDAEIEAVTGMQAVLVHQMEWSVQRVLNNDTSAISTLRCLKLYLERLGCNFLDQESVAHLAGKAFALVRECVSEVTFLNCRPSVIAAAVIYAERRARGIIPFWPSMLSKLTGYQDMSTPELSVAIKAAQRMCARMTQPSSPFGSSTSQVLPPTPLSVPPTPRSVGSMS